MRVKFIVIFLFLIISSLTCFGIDKQRNLSIWLRENKLTAGQSLSLVVNPGKEFDVPIFLQIDIVDQYLSIISQERILLNKATEYRWQLPAELQPGLYIIAISTDNNIGEETIGLPFSYLTSDIKISKTKSILPVSIDSVFYGFNLRFKTNISSGKLIYYTLQTSDSLRRTGISQIDSTGVIQIGGNNFHGTGEVIFSLQDTCSRCTIEPQLLTDDPLNSSYLRSLFEQIDTIQKINFKQKSQFSFDGNLPNVVVQTKAKTRKELYEATYVKNFMFKSIMSRDIIVDDDPDAQNFNNNLYWYLVKHFAGLNVKTISNGFGKSEKLVFRFGEVQIIVDEMPGIPPPNYINEISYIKFIPESPKGLNNSAGFFKSNSQDFAGVTATVLIYTKKNKEELEISKRRISLQVKGAIDATY